MRFAVLCERGIPRGKRGRPLVVKVGIVLDAPRIRLRVGASRTHGNELFEHDVPHLPVSCVGHAVQDDATRATRSVDVIPGIHAAVVGTHTHTHVLPTLRCRVTRDGTQVRSAEYKTIEPEARRGFRRRRRGFRRRRRSGRRRSGFRRGYCNNTFRTGRGRWDGSW